jgi:hypothetical protein
MVVVVVVLIPRLAKEVVDCAIPPSGIAPVV